MARQITERLIDDLDGSDATQTVEFAYKGKSYTVDLNDNNASDSEDALAPYIAAAGKAGSAQSSRGTRGDKRQSSGARGGSNDSSDYSPKDVRAWAQANGVEVPARGRIPGKVIEQFKASQA
jgi:hypothetical protein